MGIGFGKAPHWSPLGHPPFPVRLQYVVQALIRFSPYVVASGHTLWRTPDPIRTRKISHRRPGQYWGGGPPGKPLGAAGFLYLSAVLLPPLLFPQNPQNLVPPPRLPKFGI